MSKRSGSRFRSSMRAGWLIIAMLAVLLVTPYSAPPASAQTQQLLADRVEEFSAGNFERTALSGFQSSAVGGDQAGAVQLARRGTLRPWTNQVDPPVLTGLAGAGIAAISDPQTGVSRIFVVGGTSGSADTGGPLGSVYWTTVEPTTGTIDPWTEVALPAVRGNDYSTAFRGCNTESAGIVQPAVTALSTSGGNGFLYVIGGTILCDSGEQASSYAVRVARFDAAAGTLTWTVSDKSPEGHARESTSPDPSKPLPVIPSHDESATWPYQGATAASAEIVTVGGASYLYLLGGKRDSFSPFASQAPTSAGLNMALPGGGLGAAVYRAQIDPATGLFNAWTAAEAIPIVGLTQGTDAEAGLWDGDTTVRTIQAGVSLGDPALFAAGGQIRKPGAAGSRFNDRVYRARVAAGGGLEWTAQAGEGGQFATSLGRTNLQAVSVNGKLYLVGGKDGAASQNPVRQSVEVGIIRNEDLLLENLSPPATQPSFFDETPNALQQPLEDHAAVIVPGRAATGAPDIGAAWVFIIGGRNNAGGALSVAYRARLGSADETSDANLIPSGVYYSPVYNIRIGDDEVELLKVSWATELINPSATNDIRFEYRTINTAQPCESADILNLTAWSAWQANVDTNPDSPALSINGINDLNIDAIPPELRVATCFQYRVQIVTDSETVTPSLLYVVIEKRVAGSPDLKASDFRAISDATGTPTAIFLEILNQNPNGVTQPANYRRDGTFLVDICISAANQPVQTPVLGTGVPCSRVYTTVNRAALPAGGTVEVLWGTWWCSVDDPSTPDVNEGQTRTYCSPFKYMQTPGIYQLQVVIDDENAVSEDALLRADNISQTINVQVTADTIPDPDPPPPPPTGSQVFLPLVAR